MDFEDLEFKSHPNLTEGMQARVDFDNGYGASVITGPMFFCTPNETYELAVFKDGNITYSSGITDDVLGHLTPKEVTNVLHKIESLKDGNDNK